MKKLLFPLILTVLVLLNINPSSSNAAYDASGDTDINIVTTDEVTPSGDTADASFQLQEAAHALLTDTTGIELDHSYIWITLNGVKVLAIDPIKPTF